MAIPEHIIPNPLTGEQGQTKDGKPSYRADSCVARFRFAMVEFDTMPRGEQIQFWAGVKLPVVALIDSGGKSIHGWIRIDAANADEWTQRVEGKLFDTLAAVGADGTCKNEARLSRMPGHLRTEKEPLAACPISQSGRRSSNPVNETAAHAEDMLNEYAVELGAASINDEIILPGSGVTIKATAEELFKRIGPTETLFIRGGAVMSIVENNGGLGLEVLGPIAARSRFESYAKFSAWRVRPRRQVGPEAGHHPAGHGCGTA